MKGRFNQPVKQWIKFSVWSLIYVLFIIWVGNYWWLLLLPFIFDMFITHFIPYDWWKKYKDTNPIVYTICSWIDAIVFALVAVYFIFLYLFQNYQIPSSSLEKSLLVGDFLFVSKATYGPRVPNTPLSFPLVQHTFPWGGKSYIEKPQWEYKRLKGLKDVERDDIIVFNFPAGDTVAVRQPNPDYYTLCHYYGRDVINARKDLFGEVVWRPVDRRENYVKRCVGLPGDSLQIIDNQIYINNCVLEDHEGVQYCYYVQTDGSVLSAKLFDKLGISKSDRVLLNPSVDVGKKELESMGLDSSRPVYHLPLTRSMKSVLEQMTQIDTIVIEPDWRGGDVYPLGKTEWTRDNYGPIYLPKKGDCLLITPSNYAVYERVIRNYEGNEVMLQDGVVYINGVESNSYTFKMDYYFMMGDNRHQSADSRYWGFVPEDHIVGQPVFVWLSLNKDKGWFDGRIRWDRFMKYAGN